MSKNILFLVIIVTAAFGCHKDEKLAELRFCADILPSELCAGEDTIFPRGMVWAQLFLNPRFKDTAVIGKFYGYQNDERVLMGNKVHELDEDEKIVMEALRMNIRGNFEVEFFDTHGNLLAKKRFEIW